MTAMVYGSVFDINQNVRELAEPANLSSSNYPHSPRTAGRDIMNVAASSIARQGRTTVSQASTRTGPWATRQAQVSDFGQSNVQ